MRLRAHWGLSSGQTIGAVRTAVRPACCLPELRVANRLRRLCPLGTRFPTFPPVPFGSPPETIERPIGLQALLPRRSRRVKPRQGQGVRACGRTGGFPLAPSPLRSPLEAIECPIGLQALLPRRSRRVKPHRGRGMRLRAHWGLSARPLHPLRIANRNNRAPHRAASPLLAPTPARQPPPIQNNPRQEIPFPPGAVRMFCYPFTAPAITPDTMYFWHAR